VRSLVVTDSRIWTAETEYAVSVARAEARAGAAVTFASPGARFAAELPGIRTLDLPGEVPSKSPRDFAAGSRWLAALARRERFDVVHSARATAHLMAALSLHGGAPIVHLRGTASPPRAHPANRFLYRRLTAAVVASSSSVRRAVIERLGMPPERVHRLFAPVDADEFRPVARDGALAASLGVPAGAQVVMIASEFLKNGYARVPDLLANMTAWMEEHEYESIQQMQGSMSKAALAEPAAFERANYMKVLNSWHELP